MTSFMLDQTVRFGEFTGYIKFISEQYVTICVKENMDDPMHQVCLCVFHEKWDEIMPADLDDQK